MKPRALNLSQYLRRLSGLSLLASCACCLCTVNLSAAPTPVATLIDPSGKLPSEWWAVEWDGAAADVEPLIARPETTASLAIYVRPGAKQWSGAGVTTDPEPSKYLEIDSIPMDALVLEAWVNGGIRPDGQREGGQSLRISLRFVTASGIQVRSLGKDGAAFIPIDPFIEGGHIDADSETWQKLRMPLKDFAGSTTESIVGWYYLAVQMEDTTPTSGAYLSDVTLTTER